MMGYADYAVEDKEFNRSQILVSDASAIGATGISPISNDEDLSSSSSQQYSNIQCMLIEEVRKYQRIWDTTCRSFLSNNNRRVLLLNIAILSLNYA